MITDSASLLLEESSHHSTIHSDNQTCMRVIEQHNGQITQTANKDVRIKSDETPEGNDKTKDLINGEEIDKDINDKKAEYDKLYQHRKLRVSKNSQVTETEEANTSSSECYLEDCSPQKRREKRLKRKKRKSFMEILFV